jgi:hemerythrin
MHCKRRLEMGIIQWDSKYEVNVRKIDRQHRKIVDILNKLYDLQETDKTQRDIQKIFDNLRVYISTHFKTEEAYLREIECTGYELQKEEHNAFIDTICSYQKEYFKEKPMALINLFNFVWDWFANHILTVDKKCMEGALDNTTRR